MEYLLTILPRANNFLLIEDLVVLISDEHAHLLGPQASWPGAHH
jgi:hypothetical protein